MPARAVCPRRCAPRPWTCARPWSARDRGHGPISVHDKMASMGLKAPSPAWLARLFRREGVARAEPSKRPRAAWRRFDLPRPQRLLAARRHRVRPGRRAQGGDLAGSRTTTPAWRWPPWSPRARPVRRPSTSSTGAWPPGECTRRPRGRQRRGPGPQPAPSHRPARPGHVRSLGVEPPAGKPHHPTTQGKNERFGQTLLRHLDQQPLADSIAELQEQVDRFDHTLQHPAPPPGPARAHHRAAGLGRHRDRPGAPTAPRHRPHRPGGPVPRTRHHRRAPGALAQAHRPQRRARSRPSPATAPPTSAASRSWSAAPWPGTEPPRSGTPPPSPSPTSTARS